MSLESILIVLLMGINGVSSEMARISKDSIAVNNPSMSNKISSDDMQDVTHSRSRIDCARKCSDLDECMAFFYNKNTKSCQLHSSGLYSNNPASFTEADGYKFYRVKGKEQLPADCSDILLMGNNGSGIYTVYPSSGDPKEVYCDQDTDGGGWLVFQRRQDGSEDFYRNWTDYVQGFGNIRNEFWIGNDFLSRIIPLKQYTLRVDLKTFEGETRYAHYSWITVGTATSNYKMYVGTYSGTAGESMGRQNGSQFTTKDRDNDVDDNNNCAAQWQGAWWYSACQNSNLNGLYHTTNPSPFGVGIVWRTFKGYTYSLKETEMKIRPSPA